MRRIGFLATLVLVVASAGTVDSYNAAQSVVTKTPGRVQHDAVLCVHQQPYGLMEDFRVVAIR